MTLPVGFRLRADERTRCHDEARLLVGGSPRRVLRLTDHGATTARRLLDGEPVASARDAALARRLLDTGMAHPVPVDSEVTVDVVIPVYDDTARLDRCLASLGTGLPVTVVDDGSAQPSHVIDVAAVHNARLIRRRDNGGPAAARNAGALQCTADIVAFVDSDAVVDVATLRGAAAHFSDPLVAAVAPRVRAADDGSGALGVIARHWSPLDLGPVPGPVRPAARVSYVPSTVLLVRRDALAGVGGFDESLRYGEDVDLVWRLVATGGRVRYEPALLAGHHEPTTWRRWLRRRFLYGTSAATLARRHGGSAAPLVVQPAPAAAVGLAVAGAPTLGMLVAATTALRLRRRLRAAAVPSADATRSAVAAPAQTALGAARWAAQLWWPALVLLGRRSRRARRATAAALLAPPLVEWVKRRPPLDPLRWTLAVWADDAAYGVGVWWGCLREGTVRPVVPRVGFRRRDTPTSSGGNATA